ncbi:MAG: hypothetical protein LBH58_09790 [Tannerellaceae bacterium]|jgi:hypothetical protein|nr:hypothetical protein [Tannerellaceae bacterium]
MKIKFLVLLAVFCMAPALSQAQTESGIVVGGGIGSLRADINPSFVGTGIVNKIDYKAAFSAGYRFRLHPLAASPLFLDLDAALGLKLWHSDYGQSSLEPSQYEVSSQYYFVAASGMVGYPLYKGLRVAAGIEPTYYFRQNGEDSKNSFDIPLAGKIAYNFKIVEIGVSYKHGLMNVVKTGHIDSGKFRDWQLSVWIPF